MRSSVWMSISLAVMVLCAESRVLIGSPFGFWDWLNVIFSLGVIVLLVVFLVQDSRRKARQL